jgi:hypothetical protein
MILSQNVADEKIFLFFSPLGNSIPDLVLLSGLRRMMFHSAKQAIEEQTECPTGNCFQQIFSKSHLLFQHKEAH